LKTPKGVPIYKRAEGRAVYLGITTGGTRRCRDKNCPGYKVAVRWFSDHTLTWVCTTKLVRTGRGWRMSR